MSAAGVEPVAPVNVVDFDSHDPALAADPFVTLARMREACPVSWSDSWDGFWVASRHAEVALAARDRRFEAGHVRPDGSLQGISIPTIGQTGRLVPSELNVPECLQYRKLLAGYYSRQRVEARMDEFRQLAAECVDEVIEGGSTDLVPALTARLPAVLTMRDVGLPEDRWAEVNRIVERGLLSGPRDPDDARDAGQEVCLRIVEQMEARRGADGADGTVLSALLAATIDGEPLPDEAIVSMMYLLLLGIQPTSTFAATALWHLAKHPDLRRTLASDPARIAATADEFVRWVSPIQSTTRTVTDDLQLGGQDVRAGERVFLSWAAANRDEAVFPHGDRLDLDRAAGSHMSFGGGPHYCVGAHVARAMFTVILEEVLTRLPDYEIACEEGVRWFPDVSFVYGVTALPVTFTPGLRRDAPVGAAGPVAR